ncbi:MAG TPA: DUF4097 family beta strand repeat-containing protein [Rectinemataceae bacterium]|nr:DUF4097 family beta strand repeat-containing protein [Rectinemataceae bacterium]
MSRAETEIEPGYFNESLDPGQAERLVLRFPHGDLMTFPSEEGRITVDIEIRGPVEKLAAWKPSIRRREGIIIIADEGLDGVIVSGARIRVPACIRDIEAHSSTGSLELRDLSADILAATDAGSIRIAGGAQMELSSVSGEIEVEKVTSVAVRVGSGLIRCRDIAGPVSAESESGDVVVESAAGNVVVLSESGDISIQRPGGRLRLVTESGDVELEIAGRFAGGEVSTSTGDVSLSLGGADLELRAETLSGNLDVPGVEIPLTNGPRRCALRLGAGGRRLHVRSVSGDVEIEK